MTAFVPGEYVYMSGPLTGLKAAGREEWVTTEIYARVKRICEEVTVIPCYCPNLSDTKTTNVLPPYSVWERDHTKTKDAGAVVAYNPPDLPSQGVAMEIEIAYGAQVPVLVVYERANAHLANRFILGCPSIRGSILFDDPAEIDQPLQEWLWYQFSLRNLKAVRAEDNWPHARYAVLRESLEVMHAGQKNRALDKRRPISCDQWRSARPPLGQHVTW